MGVWIATALPPGPVTGLVTHEQDVRGYLGDDSGERSDW